MTSTMSRIGNAVLMFIAAIGAFLLFTPKPIVAGLGFLETVDQYRPWIGFLTLFAGVGFVWNVWIAEAVYALKAKRDELDKSPSQEAAAKPPSVKVIGPFLGLRTNGVRIVIAVPHIEVVRIQCILRDKTGTVVEAVDGVKVGSEFISYTFDPKNVAPGHNYSYGFLVNGQALDLEGGLRESDCVFEAPGEFAKEDSFLLMSCHNPFELAPGAAEDGWAMWPRILKLLKSNPKIRFMVLGGDQVYNDDVEKEALPWLKDNVETGRQNAVVRFTRQYQLFWENLHYRQVMARIPSIAMWDDHDITDGWGGRPQQYKAGRTEFLDHWQEYFEVAWQAFLSYQMTRNPVTKISPSRGLTFFLDFGPNRIYMLDLRSERNSKKSRVMDESHEKALCDSIQQTPEHIKRLFLLSPVVPFRTNIGLDRRLTEVSRIMFQITKWIGDRPALKRVVENSTVYFGAGFLISLILTHWSIWHATTALLFLALSVLSGVFVAILRNKDLPELSDDMDDALSSDANQKTLIRLLRVLFDWQKNGRQAAILSGDIHLAGVSEIIESTNGHAASMLQIVASPISYQPMPKAVEGFTTTTSEIVLSDNGLSRLYARNIFYTSKRNFAQVTPAAIERDCNGVPVRFFYEGYEFPISLPATYLS